MASARRSARGSLGLVILATVFAAAAGFIAIPVLFGAQYDQAPLLASIYLAQYPVVASYMAPVIALSHLGRKRWLVELPLVLCAVEALALPLAAVSTLLLAIASTLAHCLGAIYVAARLRAVAREELAHA